MRIFLFINSLLLVLILTGCSESQLEVDTSQIEINYQSKRFDRDLFSANFEQPEQGFQTLYQNYPEFYPLYTEFVLRMGPADSLSTFKSLEGFTTDSFMKEVYNEIQEIHTDEKISSYNEQIEDALKHYQYYFPDSVVPAIVYYHSGFNFGVLSADSTIGVGLDWFLGADNSITDQLPFPAYRKRKMRPDYLPASVVKDWANHIYYRDIENTNLLDHLVYYGKIMYLVDAFAPEMADSTKMNYSTEEMNWVENHEFQIWEQLATQETLFEKRPFEVQKWFIDGPFTSPLPEESPAMAGIWMGWQIVRDFMDKNEELTVQQLLAIEDNQRILNTYNPRK